MPEFEFALRIMMDDEDAGALPELMEDTFEEFPGEVHWRLKSADGEWNEAQRLRVQYLRLRAWVDTEGRNCPSGAAVDAALSFREQGVSESAGHSLADCRIDPGALPSPRQELAKETE